MMELEHAVRLCQIGADQNRGPGAVNQIWEPIVKAYLAVHTAGGEDRWDQTENPLSEYSIEQWRFWLKETIQKQLDRPSKKIFNAIDALCDLAVIGSKKASRTKRQKQKDLVAELRKLASILDEQD